MVVRKLVFLSSSGDLAKIRTDFDFEFRKWNSSLGQTELELLPYRWEMDDVLRGLDAREPIQSQLERTDGDNVLLTVGLFGERCGVPLADRTQLGRDFAAWEKGAFRLLHPWPAGIEASEEALKNGCYPLTGTIFEQLCAVDSAIEYPDRPRPFIGYVANCHVAPDTNLNDLVFNGLTLFDSALQGKAPAERAALQPALERQRWGLLNYLNALHASGKIEPIRFNSAEEMCSTLLERTKRVLLPLALPPDGSTGYRNALTFYDIRDSYPLPGLQKEANATADQFWNDAFSSGASAANRTLLLTGSSGCGKSSYMRRGILGSLVRAKKRNVIAIAFRPNDLDPHGRSNCLWLLWQLILSSDPRIETNFGMDAGQTEVAGPAAKALTEALDRIDARLLLGIDQFEEFLDILFRQSGSQSAANRLRPAFVFLRACLGAGRVAIVATLESQRDKLREDFADAEYGWWMDKTKDLNLTEERVRQIVKEPLKAVGLTLDLEAQRRIVSLWKKLEIGLDTKASPLPLLGLWLSRLQDRYSSLARKTGTELTEKFLHVSDEPVLNVDHIDDMEPMENLIDELATNAWLEVGDSYDAIETRSGRKLPAKFDLNKFLQPLVGLSQDGQKELRDVTRPSYISLASELTERFLKSRLMVPVLTDQRETVRLTHQAVIDRWMAAADWFEDFQAYLQSERVLLRNAEVWHDGGRASLPQVSEAEIDIAASLLEMLLTVAVDDMSSENALLKDYSIEVFRHSKRPLAAVPHSLVDTLHVHIAASYDLGDLLEAWLSAPNANVKKIANAKTSHFSSPLMFAAWSSPASVVTLLRYGAKVKASNKTGFHPISAAIQSGRKDILDLLIKFYDIDELVCEYDGRAMLHQAAQSGQLAILRSLIDRGASIDRVDQTGQTPLMFAVQSGNLDIVADLRSPQGAVAKMNEANSSLRAIDLGAITGNWKSIDLLVNTPGLTEEDFGSLLGPRAKGELSPLGLAAVNLRPGTVRWFLSQMNIDPADLCHRGDRYGNLAEATAAEADRHTPGYDQRLRDTLEVLLDDPRIDPTALGADGRSLHERVAHSGPAGRLVNGHARCPRDWKALNAKAALNWLREAHSDEVLRIAQHRPDLLLDKSVLSKIPKAAWPSVALVLADKVNLRANEGPRLIEALYTGYPFTGEGAPKDGIKTELLRLLIDRINPKNRAKSGGTLLALLAAKATEMEVGQLLEKRVSLDRPIGPLGSRAAHLAAQRRDEAIFELLAKAMRGKPVPRDNWGRAPSEVAPKPDRDGFAAIEAKYFELEP